MNDISKTKEGGSASVETISRTKSKDRVLWERAVIEASKDRCSNCGSEDRLRISMVVPEDAGGQLVLSNGRMLCRPCELAADAVARGRVSEHNRRALNFWISRGLYDRIQEGLKTRSGFSSMGSLIRYLMSCYVTDETRFDDLERYQDDGSDVKVNVWVETDHYATFKSLLDKRGLTVTAAIKALVIMYESEAEPLMRKR
jgi:hypothetical protein